MSAAGNYMPPMFVFPRVRENPLLFDDTPPGSIAKYHPSGWMQSDIFLSWFKSFIQFSRPSVEKPVLLILDGHATHTKSLELIDMARANHVSLLCLPPPPHCSHRLQPLDVSFMAPLSTYYQEEVRQWLVMHPGRPVTIYQVGRLFGSAFLKAAVMQTATNGFRKTGIYPLNRNIFPEHLFAPSLTTDRSKPEPRPEENAVEVPGNPQSQYQDSANKEGLAVSVSKGSAASVSNVSTPFNLTPSEPEPINLPCCSKSLNLNLKLVPETTFDVSPSDLMTPPFTERKTQPTTNKRKGKTVILTGSPYKLQLQTALTEKKRKNERKKNKDGQKKEETGGKINESKKRQLLKKPKQSRQKMSVQKEKKPKEKMWDDSREEDDNTACIFCNELYSDSKEGDGWIQCIRCRLWAHESCYGTEEGDDSFTCDLCQ